MPLGNESNSHSMCLSHINISLYLYDSQWTVSVSLTNILQCLKNPEPHVKTLAIDLKSLFRSVQLRATIFIWIREQSKIGYKLKLFINHHLDGWGMYVLQDIATLQWE